MGTVTEIHDYLRLLCSPAWVIRIARSIGIKLEAQTVSQMVDHVLAHAGRTPSSCCWRLLVVNRKGEQLESV